MAIPSQPNRPLFRMLDRPRDPKEALLKRKFPEAQFWNHAGTAQIIDIGPGMYYTFTTLRAYKIGQEQQITAIGDMTIRREEMQQDLEQPLPDQIRVLHTYTEASEEDIRQFHLAH